MTIPPSRIASTLYAASSQAPKSRHLSSPLTREGTSVHPHVTNGQKESG
jgi:hypothetical protein